MKLIIKVNEKTKQTILWTQALLVEVFIHSNFIVIIKLYSKKLSKSSYIHKTGKILSFLFCICYGVCYSQHPVNPKQSYISPQPPKQLHNTIQETKMITGKVILKKDTIQTPLKDITIFVYKNKYDIRNKNPYIVSTTTDSLGNYQINLTNQIQKLSNPFMIVVSDTNVSKEIREVYKYYQNPFILTYYLHNKPSTKGLIPKVYYNSETKLKNFHKAPKK